MTRSEGSAFPPYPNDGDRHSINRIFHREYADEAILTPQTDEQMRSLEDAYAEFTAGAVIQPSCMCGKWSSVGQCEDCQRELAEMERDCAAEERRRRDREAWKKFPRSAA